MATTADVRMDMGTRETSLPWWLVLLQGIFAAVFGLLLLIEPGGTLLFLVQVLGFYLFIEGILRLVSIFLDSSLWGLKLGIGILGVLAEIVVLNHPLLSAVAIPTYIVYVVGFLAIFEGVGGLIHASSRRWLECWDLEHLSYDLWPNLGAQPIDRLGGFAVRVGRVHASRRHCGHRGVIPPSFGP